jgi:hypothetical protein
MNADDHELLERTRKINKTLSLFAFALQEDAEISSENQLEIADLLVALADAIRARATTQQAAHANTGPLIIEAESSQSEAPESRRDRDTEQP